MKNVLKKKWLFEVIGNVNKNNGASFTAIKAACSGISNRVLTELLTLLTKKGIVVRIVKNDRSVFYQLTAKGKRFLRLLNDIMALG